MAYSKEHMEACLAAMDKATKNYLQNINIICASDDKNDPIRVADDAFLEVYESGVNEATENYFQNIDIDTICASADKENPIRIAHNTFRKLCKSGVNKKTHKTMIQLFCGLFPELKLVKNLKKKILAIIRDDEYDFTNIYEHIWVDFIQ